MVCERRVENRFSTNEKLIVGFWNELKERGLKGFDESEWDKSLIDIVKFLRSM